MICVLLWCGCHCYNWLVGLLEVMVILVSTNVSVLTGGHGVIIILLFGSGYSFCCCDGGWCGCYDYCCSGCHQKGVVFIAVENYCLMTRVRVRATIGWLIIYLSKKWVLWILSSTPVRMSCKNKQTQQTYLKNKINRWTSSHACLVCHEVLIYFFTSTRQWPSYYTKCNLSSWRKDSQSKLKVPVKDDERTPSQSLQGLSVKVCKVSCVKWYPLQRLISLPLFSTIIFVQNYVVLVLILFSCPWCL